MVGERFHELLLASRRADPGGPGRKGGVVGTSGALLGRVTGGTRVLWAPNGHSRGHEDLICDGSRVDLRRECGAPTGAIPKALGAEMHITSTNAALHDLAARCNWVSQWAFAFASRPGLPFPLPFAEEGAFKFFVPHNGKEGGAHGPCACWGCARKALATDPEVSSSTLPSIEM